MQRLFSTFADGWPGGGILLLRALAGSALLCYAAAPIGANQHTAAYVLHLVDALAGILILAGLWTPVAGILAAAAQAWLAFSQPPTQPITLALAAVSISLAMIGPGAWSVDARLYGRKQLLPPES